MTIQGKPKMAIFGDDGRRHRGDVRVMMLGTSAVREGGNLTIPKEKKMAGFSDDDRLRGGCPSYDDTESMQGVVRTVCTYIYIYIYMRGVRAQRLTLHPSSFWGSHCSRRQSSWYSTEPMLPLRLWSASRDASLYTRLSGDYFSSQPANLLLRGDMVNRTKYG